MKRLFRRVERAQAFRPSLVGILVNPFFLARRALAAAISDLSPYVAGRVLDVGCGTQPYRSLFAVDEYVGLEIDSPTTRERGVADVFYDGGVFPFEDQQFDTVVCNQVLEHVFVPDQFLGEVHRILVPGGRLLLTVPFVWDEHEQPYDFARYSSFGLRALLERAGLEVVEERRLLADVSILFQLLNAYLFKVVPARRTARIAITVFVMAPISLLGLVAGRALPKNPDLFLDQAVVAKRPD